MKNSDIHTKQTVGSEIIKIDTSSLGAKIYEIRGEKVMLDFDLAEIYGYTTSAFNRQVKNNIEKFDEDFMFQLTPDELALCLRSQNVTLNSAGNRRGEHFKYLPYAFTEQGIYMLMTVLHGELAKADEALIGIYAQAEHSIIIVDNYIDIKTLRHLQKIQPDIAVTIFSDNLGRYLSAEDYRDFRKEFPDIKIDFRQNGKHIHDRFIILDFDTERERVFHCGASMKDAGSKLTLAQTLAYFPAYDKILLER